MHSVDLVVRQAQQYESVTFCVAMFAIIKAKRE